MSKKILLVEDEALIAISEAQMLKKHGYEVVTAYSGEKAIDVVDSDPEISLILMDIDLGSRMDGTEAAEQILEKHDLPIVFLTSHAEKEYVDKVKTITGSGYILKNSGEFVLIESIHMAFNLFEAKREAQHHLRETELRESRLNHLNRLLLSIRNVNQIITKETDIGELLDKTCSLLIETSGYERAWIVLLRDGKPEEPYFHAGFSGAFEPMTDFLNGGQIPVCAEAALQSNAIRALVQNTANCGNCPFRQRETTKACAEAEKTVLTAKLEHAGELQGWISVLAPKMYANNRDDQRLFEEIAGDISYALQSIDANKETIETKELLENTMNAIPDAIGVLDSNFTVISYNSAGYQLLGQTPEKVEGKKCYELINRSVPCEICAVKKSYATKKIEQFERYEAVLDRWIDLRAYPILDTHGNIIKIIEHFRDITDRKRAEEALKERNRTAHQFFSESAAGAFFMLLDKPIEWNDSVDKEKVLDYVFAHQRITQINTAMLDQYLAREEEFLGKTPNQLFAHDLEHGRSLWRKMFDQGFLSIDSNERRFDGSQLWIVGSYRCMYDEQGRITGHFGTQHDITDLKQAEEKLREALKEKDFLMKELNHRVKNNLAMVSSLINLKDSETEADLSGIKHQIEAIGLIHEKLYQTGNATEISCRDYISDLLNSIFSSFSKRPVRIETNIDEISIPTKQAMSLGLIVNEIATNAIKHGFNEKEEAVFSITMEKDKEKNQYELTLSNTGKPFPEDIDANNPQTLGLRLISALTEQLGGTIDLKRVPHPVFTIRFPIGE